MILKLTCFFLLAGCLEPTKLVKYRQIWNTTVIESSQTSLKLVDSFKVSEIFFCPSKCNLLPGCQAATLNSSNHCTLFSDQITTLDLKAENGTLMMTKKPIRVWIPNTLLTWTRRFVRPSSRNQRFVLGTVSAQTAKDSFVAGGLVNAKIRFTSIIIRVHFFIYSNWI